MSRGTTVYFARMATGKGPIKIGCSGVPAERILSLATWAPYPLKLLVTVPGSFKTERLIHDCFADAHSHSEWFRPIPRLLDAIDKIKSGVPLEQAIDLSKPIASIRKRRNYRPWSAEKSRYYGYVHRLRWAAKRYSESVGADYRTPLDVDAIVQQAERNYHFTDEQLARMDAVLADPGAYFVTRDQKYPHLAFKRAAA